MRPFDQAAKAARLGRVDELAKLIEADHDLITARDDDGDTLLGLACRAATGDIAIPPVAGTPEQHAAVDYLLSRGAYPSASRNDGWSPLHTAAMSGHVDLAKRLLESGARREGHLYGLSGGSPLSLALFYAKTAVAEVLARPPIPDNLRIAAALGNEIDRFIDGETLTPRAAEGVDFYRPLLVFPEWERSNSREELINEALTWSSRNGQLTSMERLVEIGADVNANPYRGTALLWAAYANKLDAMRWLLERGADPNLRHDFGGQGHGVQATAAHLAAQFDEVDVLRVLLDYGADFSIADGAFNGTPLDWAKHGEATRATAYLESL